MGFREDSGIDSAINAQPLSLMAGNGLSKDALRIKYINEAYYRYLQFWRPDIERAVRNARMYWHVDYGQWPREAVEKLRNEGRRPPTIPIIPDKVETLVGSILANGFDIHYESPSPKYDELSLALQDMYYSDSQNFNWDMAEVECLLDSCIYAGYERMAVNTKYSPYGNIDFESINPRHVLLDPGWKTNNINDLDNYIVFNDLTATQIVELFPDMLPLIRSQFLYEQTRGVDYGINLGAVPDTRDLEKKWGDYHRVIEFHSVVRKTGYWEWDKKNGCYFPTTGYMEGTPEDKQAKIEYITNQNLGPDDITMVPRKWSEKHIETCVPTLLNHTFLTTGLDPVQCGNINLFPLGIRYNGQFQGIVVDRLYDIQLAVNKAEMNTQDIMARSAKASFMLDRALTGGDNSLEQQITDHWNEPGAKVWVAEGTTKNLGQNGGIVPFPESKVPYDQGQLIGRYLDYSNQFAKTNAAMGGQQDYAKESGRLFEYKFQAGQVAQRHLMKLIEQHKRDKAEAYYEQAKVLYANGERVFTGTKSGKPILINTSQEDVFDLQSVPRMKISIVPSPDGVSVRADQKNEIGQALSLMLDPNDRLAKTILLGRIFSLSDMTDADREEMTHAFDLIKLDAGTQLLLRVKQTQMQLDQMNAAQQAPMAPSPLQNNGGGSGGIPTSTQTYLPGPPGFGGELGSKRPTNTEVI